MSNPLPEVTIYADGACEPNPGRGGIGVVLLFGDHRKEISRAIGRQTNNSAEIIAATEGLNALKMPCRVKLYSDSQYLVRTMKREYNRSTNLALWYTLDAAAERHSIEWLWVRGHNGDPNNERADQLAVMAARSTSLELFEDFK